MRKERIGFVGVGIMGHGMAGRLLAAGHPLSVIAHRNRAPIDDLVRRGATEAADLAKLAAASDVVIFCVGAAETLVARVAELSPHLSPDQMIIDTGTTDPNTTRRLHRALAEIGVAFVEAPMTGGAVEAAEGRLGALVGGDAAAFQRARPILDPLCATVEHFGGPGDGATAKLLYNFMALGIAALVTETFAHARDAGVDWEKLYAVSLRGSGDSGVLRRIIGGHLAGDPAGYKFSVANAAKDLRYFCETAPDFGGPTALAEAVRAAFEAAEASGRGDALLSALVGPPPDR